MAPGTWQVTVSATGYDTFTQSVEIRSGTNALPRDYLFTTPVQFRVGIQIGANKLLTCRKATPTCATVSLLRIDTFQSYRVDTATDSRYVFNGLNPATYLVTVSGNGINQVSTVYTVVLGVSPQTLDIPVTLINNNVNGKVVGPTGRNSTLTPLNKVSVELGHLDDDGSFVVDEGTDGNDLVVATGATAGLTGIFVFTNVPNGTYVARVNHGTPDIPVLNGYGETITTAFVSVTSGQTATFPDTTLPRVTHPVDVSVTTTADGDDVAAGTVTLTSTSDPTWVFTPQPATSVPVANGVRDTWRFTDVPFGDWTLAITLPAGHFGSLTGSNPALTCTAGSSTTPVKCSGSPLTVPGSGDPSTAVTVAYTLAEFRVGVSVVPQRLATDPRAVPPTPVQVAVADGAATVYSASIAVSETKPPTPTGSFWGRTGHSYTTKTTTGAANWTAQEVTLTGAAPDTPVTIVEKGATVTVTVNGLRSDKGATVTLAPPAGSGVTAPASQDTGTASQATFETSRSAPAGRPPRSASPTGARRVSTSTA